LVERVVGVLLELLSDSGLSLIQTQSDAAAILLHLVESSLLVLSVCGRVSSLGVSVDLAIVLAACQRQSIEGVVDTRGVDI
jgi:hypothetical protein